MLELAVKLRQETGKKNNHFRKQGLIPAILYGHKIKNLPLIVNYLDFEKIYQEAGESTLIKLKIRAPKHPLLLRQREKEGVLGARPSTKEFSALAQNSKLKTISKERVVLIHDVQRDAVTDKFIHIDFYQVKMDEVLKAEVPLEFIGQSPAVVEQGGVLVKSIQQIEVEALPKNLPREIKVDISSLQSFDDNIHIKDLELPAGVKIMAELEEVVASVVPPRKEAELKELEKAPEEKVEEVKVEPEEKREIKAEEPEGQP